MLEFIFDTTRTVTDLVLAGVFTPLPDIEWILHHGGGALPLIADRVDLFRRMFLGSPGEAESPGPSVQEQLAGRWYDIAGTPFPNQVPSLVKAFGPDRILYGSDYCWTAAMGVTAQLAAIDGAEQPPNNTWRGLTTRNAVRLFGQREEEAGPAA